MINMKSITKLKTKKVRKAAERAEIRWLYRSGGYLRRVAQSTIRRGSGKPQPGSPPKSRTGRLKRLIRFGLDRPAKTMYVGPVVASDAEGGYRAGVTVPQMISFGGTAKTKDGKKVTYKAFPFMDSALEKSQPKIAEFWADSVKGGA